MFTLLGLVIVFAGILGGYMWAGGPLHVLVQPAQLAIIGGAAVGTLVMAAPGKMRGRLFAAIGKAFRSSAPTRDDYLDLLRLQYEVFSFMRKHGAVLLDDHLRDVHQSTIFRKYPSFLRRPVAVEFFRDATPKQIGHNVGAALVGTFLGILLCYGLLHPIATNAELQEVSSGKYLRCIKEGVIASLKGAAPIVAVEFARKAIFSDERPSSDETDAACRAVKAAAG